MILAIALLTYFGGYLLSKEAGIWALITLVSLPVLALVIPAEFKMADGGTMAWFWLGVLVLVILKRLSSNWGPLPDNLPRGKVFINRLFRDRDVDDRSKWVERIPDASN